MVADYDARLAQLRTDYENVASIIPPDGDRFLQDIKDMRLRGLEREIQVVQGFAGLSLAERGLRALWDIGTQLAGGDSEISNMVSEEMVKRERRVTDAAIALFALLSAEGRGPDDPEYARVAALAGIAMADTDIGRGRQEAAAAAVPDPAAAHSGSEAVPEGPRRRTSRISARNWEAHGLPAPDVMLERLFAHVPAGSELLMAEIIERVAPEINLLRDRPELYDAVQTKLRRFLTGYAPWQRGGERTPALVLVGGEKSGARYTLLVGPQARLAVRDHDVSVANHPDALELGEFDPERDFSTLDAEVLIGLLRGADELDRFPEEIWMLVSKIQGRPIPKERIVAVKERAVSNLSRLVDPKDGHKNLMLVIDEAHQEDPEGLRYMIVDYLFGQLAKGRDVEDIVRRRLREKIVVDAVFDTIGRSDLYPTGIKVTRVPVQHGSGPGSPADLARQLAAKASRQPKPGR